MKKLFSICGIIAILAMTAGCTSREPSSSSADTSSQATETTSETTTAPTTTAHTTAPATEGGQMIDGIYQNSDPAYTIKLPEGWMVGDSSDAVVLFVAEDYPMTADNININTTNGTMGDPAVLKPIFEATYTQMGEDFAWIGYEDTQLDGLSGLRMEYTLTMAEIPMHFVQYVLDDGSNTYTLTATFVSDDDALKQAVLESLESFKLA